ncbi:50S ribosomal protein L21 [Candidatus Peregrinibacteria bacterium]|nr:50S ribosomal protein L21 [Candidatus Peregrinibacteria bacterium]
MFAIVEIAGKQFKVSAGDKIEVPKLKDNNEGDKVKTEKVLLNSNEGKTNIGAPYVAGASVEFTVLSHGKGDKIRVFKKKSKKRFEKTQGHRQQFTKIEVTAVK